MFAHRFRKRTENDAGFGQLGLERCCNGHAVEYSIDGDAGKSRAFVQRNAQLVIGLQQLWIDFVQAFRPVRRQTSVPSSKKWTLEIDCRVVHVRPGRFGHFAPLTVGLEAPLQHELRLSLQRGNRTHNGFIETRRQALAFDFSDEPVFVSTVNDAFNIFG